MVRSGVLVPDCGARTNMTRSEAVLQLVHVVWKPFTVVAGVVLPKKF